jgi:hypothetical protein
MGLASLYAGRKLYELATLPAAIHGVNTTLSHGESHEDLSPGVQAVYIAACIFLTVVAGLMSGLTLGLMSLDR